MDVHIFRAVQPKDGVHRPNEIDWLFKPCGNQDARSSNKCSNKGFGLSTEELRDAPVQRES